MGQHIGNQEGTVIATWTVDNGPFAGVKACDVEFRGKFNGMIRSIEQSRFIVTRTIDGRVMRGPRTVSLTIEKKVTDV